MNEPYECYGGIGQHVWLGGTEDPEQYDEWTEDADEDYYADDEQAYHNEAVEE
jgi:hypothetical protein